MAIQVFPDVVLPNRVIEAGVRGKQMRRNTRVMMLNGHESINAEWSQALREYEIGFIPMRREAWQAIETLHDITKGGAYGFLMEDPKDSVVTVGVVASLGDGAYQLYKRSLDAVSGRWSDRKITRPRAAGFTITVSETPLSEVEYSLDVETGIVTIPAEPPIDVIAWTGRFYVPVHFQADSIDWSLVIAGPSPDARYLAGPSCILEEVRE
jgi:uncharacterized protein (TIGR02217 family)